ALSLFHAGVIAFHRIRVFTPMYGLPVPALVGIASGAKSICFLGSRPRTASPSQVAWPVRSTISCLRRFMGTAMMQGAASGSCRGRAVSSLPGEKVIFKILGIWLVLCVLFVSANG